VTCRPDSAGPSQTCWPPIHKCPAVARPGPPPPRAGHHAPWRRSAVPLPPRAGSVPAVHQRWAGQVRLACPWRKLGRDAQLQRRGSRHEPAGGKAHCQRPVRPVSVVFGPPGIQRGRSARTATARRTWIRPCRVPHHRARPVRTTARTLWPGLAGRGPGTRGSGAGPP
jgi:hypothetical protein